MSKDKMIVLMPLNRLANCCGYFYNCNFTEAGKEQPDVNNGYNCRHPDCGDEENGIGCCRADTCPLAYPADGMICQHSTIMCEECGKEGCACDSDMMVVEINPADLNSHYMYPVKEEF